MMTMNQLENKLRRADRKQAVLYLFCNFVSLLLITAYSAMMFSPTVLLVLPEGGDSRKQMAPPESGLHPDYSGKSSCSAAPPRCLAS